MNCKKCGKNFLGTEELCASCLEELLHHSTARRDEGGRKIKIGFGFLLIIVFGILFLPLFKPQSVILTAEEEKEIRIGVTGNANPKIVIALVTEQCPACKYAEAYLKENKIKHVIASLDRNDRYYRYYNLLAEKLGRGVPKIIVGNEAFSGFSPAIFKGKEHLFIKDY